MFPDQRHHLLHLVHHRHQKRDADVIITFLKFPNQLALRWVLQHYCRCIEILRDIVQPEMNVDSSRAEESLRSRHLAVKEFVPYGRGVTELRANGSADAG